MSSQTLRQELYADQVSQIPVFSCTKAQLHRLMPSFLQSIENKIVGLAALYSSKACLTTLAIASQSQIILVTNPAAVEKPKKHKLPLPYSLEKFLCDPELIKCAFEMDKLSMALYQDCHMRITGGRDLLEYAADEDDAPRYSFKALCYALALQTEVSIAAARKGFLQRESTASKTLEAWAAGYAASLPHMKQLVYGSKSINTARMGKQTLDITSKVIRNGGCLRLLKPCQTKHDVANICATTKDGVVFRSERFQNRIMRTSGDQFIKAVIKTPDGKQETICGTTYSVKGRTGVIKSKLSVETTSTVLKVTTFGREAQTNAERLKTRLMLETLQGLHDISCNPFICKIWLNNPGTLQWPKALNSTSAPQIFFPSSRKLNISQEKAVCASLSKDDSHRVVVIHGPPGTGKTTVIAAIVTSIIASQDKGICVWLVAQSNVAVKNIAEKLASVPFYDFKILVSENFHFEWHDHLYEKIEKNVILSSRLAKLDPDEILGCRVILCTLSMVSHLHIGAITKSVPLRTVVFDEASQVEIGDYIPLLVNSQSSLRKLVFIGDNKQLAPYGSSDVKGLESIFEKGHLRKRAILLDTQYRMPIPIGDFISKHVYDGQLRSEHEITETSCCRFIDVSSGREKSNGHSWENVAEVAVAIDIARQFEKQGKSFRIITPYDPQRCRLEAKLKEAKLAWEDKCFNVDAFQGNEDDYIIISLVRSASMGFLKERRRVNVMLTRCKKGMVILTSRKFVEGPAADSLIGKLRKSLPDSVWLDDAAIQSGGANVFP